MKAAQKEMQERLTDDKILVIFPEGTTNDGRAVKPFKSGFFELAAQTDPPLPVQPVTITYTHSNGEVIPNEEGAREHIAWIGDASFLGHFIALLGLRSIRATMVVGDKKYLPNYESRKELAQECQNEISVNLTSELDKLAQS
jgi:1-acyl-sn-glycerol-3-phosphate acyltransferase